MKLQIENNSSSDFIAPTELASDISSENGSAEVTRLLRSGIKSAQEGNRAEARNLLLQATEIEPKNENAWLWLASISEYPEELLIFLSNVLGINPANERALEWEKSTKSLLSKTFVQRGIEASRESQAEFAKQCFWQAIVHDSQNEMAWLWLASISDVIEEKRAHLQKVLSINPKNETALESLKSVKNEMAKVLLKKAQTAAAAGDRPAADKVLSEILNYTPNLEDAWLLKSFLTDSFSEKVGFFEKVLSINPENEAAAACLASMQTVLEKTTPQVKADETAKTEVAPEFEKSDEADAEILELIESIAEEDDDDDAQVEETAHVETVEETVQVETVYPETESAESSSEGETFYTSEEIAQFPTQELKYTEEFSPEEMSQPAKQRVNQSVQIIEDLEEYFDSQNEMAEDTEDEEAEMHMAFSGTEETQAEEAETFAEESEEVFAKEESDHEQFQTEASEMFAEEAVETEEAVSAETAEAESPAAVESAPKAETVPCTFCEAGNEPQNFICQYCHAMLTLSDVEMLLAHQDADRDLLEKAVERMEIEKSYGDYDAENLKQLGIAQINLKNLRRGFEYLQEAVQMNPNDVLLSSQVNSLAIRLSEIEEKQHNHELMPQNKTILVVDDSATVRKLISGKLEKCGHEVICAVDGMDALEKINEGIPDLILLDITMPRMDGYQVCKLIRSNDATKDVPVVMISGKDGFFDKVRGRMAGTTGYITKPFGPETLMKTVETYID